jgi:hypothetical protein
VPNQKADSPIPTEESTDGNISDDFSSSPGKVGAYDIQVKLIDYRQNESSPKPIQRKFVQLRNLNLQPEMKGHER